MGGWSLGAEVMTAWNYAFIQYEDYKGLVDDIRLWGRAPTGEEIAAWAGGKRPPRRDRLLAHFAFEEGRGDTARDQITPGYELKLHRMTQENWSIDNAPSQLEKPLRRTSK